MKNITVFFIKLFGYLYLAAGSIISIIGIFGSILFLVTKILTGFHEINFALVKNLLNCIFWGVLIFMVGIGVLGKKRWGRKLSIMFLLYSILMGSFYFIKYIISNEIFIVFTQTKLAIFIILYIFHLALLSIFISPSIKKYFRINKQNLGPNPQVPERK